MKKISYGQMIVSMLLMRLFFTMTYIPLNDDDTAPIMLSILVSTLIQAVLVIPILLIYKKYPGRNIISLAYASSKIMGFILTFIYSFFMILLISKIIRYFGLFFETNAKGSISILVVSVILVAGAYYISTLGIEAIARGAVICMVFFAVCLAVILYSTAGKFDILNFSFNPEFDNTFINSIFRELSRSSDIVLLTMFLPHIKEKMAKGVYWYMAIKIAVIEIIIVSCVMVLGSFINLSEFPFFMLGIYAKTTILERLDALFLPVWTLTALIKLSFFIYFSGECIKTVFKKTNLKIVTAVTTLIGAVPALYLVKKKIWYINSIDKTLIWIMIVLLAGIIPIIVYAVRRAGKNEK